MSRGHRASCASRSTRSTRELLALLNRARGAGAQGRRAEGRQARLPPGARSARFCAASRRPRAARCRPRTPVGGVPRNHFRLPRAGAGHPRRLPRAAGHLQRAGGAPAFRPRAWRPSRRRPSTRCSAAPSPARRSSRWCRWRIPPTARSAARSTCCSPRRCRICGEIELRVRQNLLSRMKGIEEIRKIYSHAQSLAQCNGWLGQQPAEGRAHSGRLQRRGRAPRGEGEGRGGDRRRGRRGALQAEDPRARHRGRPEQHHALPGARPGRCRRPPAGTAPRS